MRKKWNSWLLKTLSREKTTSFWLWRPTNKLSQLSFGTLKHIWKDFILINIYHISKYFCRKNFFHVQTRRLNPFHATGLFPYALKTSGFVMFSRTYLKEARCMKWINWPCLSMGALYLCLNCDVIKFEGNISQCIFFRSIKKFGLQKKLHHRFLEGS